MNLTGRPAYQKGAQPVAPALRRASLGATCTLRIPGVCLNGSDTVVGCHIRLPGFCGIGQKPSDLFMIDGCAACHAVLDNRARWAESACGWDDVLRALMETQQRRLDAGLIRLG